MLATAACAGAALFGQATLQHFGILESIDWLVLSLIAFPLAFALGLLRFKKTTRILLVIEIATVGLVVLLLSVIYIKLFAGTAPAATGFSLEPFIPADG